MSGFPSPRDKSVEINREDSIYICLIIRRAGAGRTQYFGGRRLRVRIEFALELGLLGSKSQSGLAFLLEIISFAGRYGVILYSEY